MAALISTLLSCSVEPESELVPAGPLFASSIQFQLAVYYLPKPSKDPWDVLRQILAQKHDMPRLVTQMQEMPSEPVVVAYIEDDVRERYRPPDMSSLGYFGRGLPREQALALQESEQAFILDFGHPGGDVWKGLRMANEIAESLARETDGLLWDEETREVFSPDEWHRMRLASWTEDVPYIPDHTTLHIYESGKETRAITLGMTKVGLPDVVVEDFSSSIYGSVENLINLFCQAMAEGATLGRDGKLDLDLGAIKNSKVREYVRTLKPNVPAVALLSLRKGSWEKGDPPNRLVEITFDRYRGRDLHARQEDMLSTLSDWVIPVSADDAELVAASQQAKGRLPALREAFIMGLQPGEHILVKAPFTTTDGREEFMWVEVRAWSGERITGLLENNPSDVKSLHFGETVEVEQADVFDYLRRYPDGREEGNETGAILKKREQEKGR